MSKFKEFPICDQRFYGFRLSELIDFESYQVENFLGGAHSPVEVAEKVIRAIEYPLYLGQPDDLHKLNNFHGKWCKTESNDFWQMASETAAIGIGDCEDSSILAVAGLRRFGLTENEVYEVFGVVREADSGRVLGGHGWVLAILKTDPEDTAFRLVESTLDTPPDEYPIVAELNRPFRMKDWEYVPEWLWNDKEFFVVGKAKKMGVLGISMGKKARESIEKYRAIEEMWEQPTKPLERIRESKIYKLKRKLRLAKEI